MIKTLQYIRYTYISIFILYLFFLFVDFLFTTNLEFNMLFWGIEVKFFFSLFIFCSLIFNLLIVSEEEEETNIKCTCPYCEKDIILIKNKDNNESNYKVLKTE